MSEHRQIVVIGGGISGLSFARFAKEKQQDVLLLEKESRLGGCIETITEQSGILIERGTHTLYRSYTSTYGLLTENFRDKSFPNPKFRNFVDSQGKQTPFWQRFSPLGCFCLPKWVVKKPQGQSLSAFFMAILGKKNYQQLFGPAFDALYCQPSCDYPAELLFKKRDRKKLGHLPKGFFYEAGMSSVIQNVADGVAYRLNQTVSDIQYKNRQYIIHLRHQEKPLTCDKLVIATQPSEAMRLLSGIEGMAETVEIPEYRVMSLSMLYQGDNFSTDAGLIGWHCPVFSAVFAKRLPAAPDHRHGVTLHYRDSTISDQAAIEIAANILGIEPSAILNTWRKENALPALRPSHLPAIREFCSHLPATLSLLGNYFDGFSIEDCINRSKKEAARLCSARE